MNMDDLEIVIFSPDNFFKYREYIHNIALPPEFYILSGQKRLSSKTIYLLKVTETRKRLFSKCTVPILIGYCIMFDSRCYKRSLGIYDIPEEIVAENPVVLSDFMIAEKYRGKGIGKQFAHYILNEVYAKDRICLHAVDDGLFFWDKFGFEDVDGSNSMKILKDGERSI